MMAGNNHRIISGDEKKSAGRLFSAIKKEEHIAEFTMDNARFLIFPDYRENGYNSVRREMYNNNPEYEISGDLKIGKKRYLIVLSKNRQAESGVGKSPVDVLTKRELQIVTLVADGRVNKQIADQLNISEWTVSTHLRRIFAKLGVDSRAAMVYRCSDLIGHTS